VLDRPTVLLAAGLVILFLVYTGWGISEMLSLSGGSLP
jgi:hypothetical protein